MNPLIDRILSRFVAAALTLSVATSFAARPAALFCGQVFEKLPTEKREVIQREQWFHSSLPEAVQNAIKLQVQWTHFSRYGLRDGEKVYWLQQSYLKELNEKLWDLGGTEFYLGNLDSLLSAHLKAHPHLGRIVHRNYKDRVILSPLSASEFNRLVLAPVRQKLLEEILALKNNLFFGNDPRFTWQKFIHHSLQYSQGASLEEAFLNLKLRSAGKNFEQWKQEALTARKSLSSAAEARGLPWEEVLRNAQSLKIDSSDFSDWRTQHGLSATFHADLKRYLELLKIADFLPTHQTLNKKDLPMVRRMITHPGKDMLARAGHLGIVQHLTRGAWDFSRALFLEQAQTNRAHFLLATDIKGLGARALVARDQWVEAGATLQTLSRVYDAPTEELNQFYKTLSDDLTRILDLPNEATSYISGDDGLWALPNLSVPQQQKLIAYLKRNPRLYAHLEPIEKPGDFESLGEAIYKVRENLFNQKPAKK